MVDNFDDAKSLIADQLLADPRVDLAKNMLLQVVQEYQQKLTAIKGPTEGLQQGYQDLLEEFARYRGSKLWFPYLGSGIGNGALVELADGSVKYDFISGIGPHYLGHSSHHMIRASIEAALSNTIMQGHLQQNVDSVDLCRYMTQISEFDHCFLSSSGAMANENGIKIAFQKRSPANRILAFEKGFAGRTLLLSQITDKPAFREGLPSTVFIDYLPFFDAHHPDASTKKAVDLLEKYLLRYPKQYALMVFELIQGEGGFYPGSELFFSSLMSILKKNQISILVDEIQTFGRTSSLFAFQYFGLQKWVDIVTIGKLSQVCATLFQKDHAPRTGLLSQTFTGSTSAIRASMSMLRQLMNGNFFGYEGKNRQIELLFAKNFEKLAIKYPGKITGPFGIGSMVAFTPFEGEAKKTVEFVHRLFQAGVICFTAGSDPTRVRFLVPAGAVTVDDINKVTQIVEEVLRNY